ncbi:MAG: DEAD/DEAH box helicase family protein [Acidimicrobiaceae bacterium]|nr:DEAD/DEAH box helicase family protein [Acidimicrobiaceae bacterium]
MTLEPGLRQEELLTGIDDSMAARLLPAGAFRLMKTLQPSRLEGPDRPRTLARLFSVETAVDDPLRRSDVIGLLPASNKAELADRLGCPLGELQDTLSAAQRRVFLGFLGAATTPETAVAGGSLPEVVLARRSLFPHQKRVASEVERFLYRESRRVMLHLPTGVGKTRTAMSIVATHLRQRPQGLVVWLAAGRELLEQAAEEFQETWTAVGDRPTSCLRFWSNHDPDIDGVADGIVIAGLAKLHLYGAERQRIWDLGNRTSLVVFDEAHQAVATTYIDLVQTLVTRNPGTGLLGLSATPGRTWADVDADLAVAELFDRNKVTLDFDGENLIEKLTADGYLARASFNLLNVEPGLALAAEDLRILQSTLDISDDVRESLGDDEQRNLRIVQRLLEMIERHSRVLVFAASVRNALLLASVLRALGIDAEAITGTTDAGQRTRAIGKFKRVGGKRVLVNFGVLTTGFDAPSASAALIARPTKSLVLYSQMVGRVIRGPKAGGTDTCEIVTVVDTTLPGFGDVAQAFMNWEDIWTV